MIRVALADDDEIVRMGLRVLVNREDDLELVGEAADGAGAVAIVRSAHPDVLLLDLRMPGLDGIGVLRAIAAEPQLAATRVIVVTTFELDSLVAAALQAGASGFLLKTTPPSELAAAIRACASGDLLFAPTVTRRLVETYVRRPPSSGEVPARLAGLTEREVDVLRELARGLSNAEIAGRVWLSPETVKTHVKAILGKLGVRDRTQAVVWAYRTGFVGPDQESSDAPSRR